MNGIDTDGYQVDDQEVVEFLVSEEISTVDWNNSKLSKMYDDLYDFALIMYWCQGNKPFLSLLDTHVFSFLNSLPLNCFLIPKITNSPK